MSDSPPGFAADWRAMVAALPPARAAELARRARAAPLYAHAYALHLNLRFGMAPEAVLDFAAGHGLRGVKIHVEDGEALSLRARDAAGRRAFGARAAALGLDLHVETSHTGAAELTEAVEIARATGATSIRCYPRHAGRLSAVLAQVVDDLRLLARLDPEGRFAVTLEQHEDLRSPELVHVLEQVGNPRLHLLFDFGNMINALETPMAALAVQAPRVTEVHVKDAVALPDRGGWAHRACLTGQGHLPMQALLVGLLLLGADRPQVTAFALEEEEDYLAPAFRFPGEGPDPVIPPRAASETPVTGPLGPRLARERAAADRQVAEVRRMLAEIATAAEATPAPR